jgi:hypothetical protein
MPRGPAAQALDRFYACSVVFLSEGAWPLDQIRLLSIPRNPNLPSSANLAGGKLFAGRPSVAR